MGESIRAYNRAKPSWVRSHKQWLRGYMISEKDLRWCQRFVDPDGCEHVVCSIFSVVFCLHLFGVVDAFLTKDAYDTHLIHLLQRTMLSSTSCVCLADDCIEASVLCSSLVFGGGVSASAAYVSVLELDSSGAAPNAPSTLLLSSVEKIAKTPAQQHRCRCGGTFQCRPVHARRKAAAILGGEQV